MPCNECEYCLNDNHTACETLHKTNYDPGGFSEFIRIPEINVEHGVYVLPKDVSFEEGTFIEPLGCVVRGQRIVEIKNDDTVLVIGSGISGILHIQLAKRLTNKITAVDVNEHRIKMAKEFGAANALNANEEIKRKFNKVIVCTGALEAAKNAFKLVDKGGTILFFAVPKPDLKLDVPINDFWRNEISIKTSYGAAPGDLEEALELIKDKKINVHDMITHRLSLADIAKGFKLVAEAKDSLKVVVEL